MPPAPNRMGSAALNQLTTLDVPVYVCIGLGYLYAVTFGWHVTPLSLVAISACQAIWVFAYRALGRASGNARAIWPWGLALLVSALGVVTCVTLGTGFDWLLPVITAGVVTTMAPLRWALAQAAVLLAGTLALIWWPFNQPVGTLWGQTVSLMIAFAFSMVFSYLVTQQIAARERALQLVAELARSEGELRDANARLAAYAGQVAELSTTRERNRIARDIHDTLGHFLTILAVKLETAQKLEERGDERLRAELAEARRVAAECLTEVRQSVAALRPSDSAGPALTAGLRRLAEEFEASDARARVTVDIEGDVEALAAETRLTLFRAAQEALTNIRKHARASRVLLRLRANADLAELTVLDDGAADEGTTDDGAGFGLRGMRERVALLGGSVSAGPDRERGWRVAVIVPATARPPRVALGEAIR